MLKQRPSVVSYVVCDGCLTEDGFEHFQILTHNYTNIQTGEKSKIRIHICPSCAVLAADFLKNLLTTSSE